MSELERVQAWLDRGYPTGGMALPSNDRKTPSIISDIRALLSRLRAAEEALGWCLGAIDRLAAEYGADEQCSYIQINRLIESAETTARFARAHVQPDRSASGPSEASAATVPPHEPLLPLLTDTGEGISSGVAEQVGGSHEAS